MRTPHPLDAGASVRPERPCGLPDPSLVGNEAASPAATVMQPERPDSAIVPPLSLANQKVPQRRLRSVARLLLLGVHFVRGWFELRVLFRRMQPRERRRRVKAWCERLLRASGVSLAVHGSVPAGGPILLVANHVSWLDMVVLQSLLPCRFVAKAEVRRWPLIGTMATLCRTLYIDRSAPRATAAVAKAMAQALGAGDTLVLFPEGTSSDGTRILPFRASLLQGAIDARAPVMPVALRYLDAATQTVSRGAAFANDDTLLGAMWRALGRDVTVRVAFGEAMSSPGRPRRALATDLHAQVASLHVLPEAT